jgi:hypothetical protein
LGALLAIVNLWAEGTDRAALRQLAELDAQLAANPTNAAVLIQLAKLHHNEAARGAEDAAFHIGRAQAHLSALLAAEPKHAFGRALLGSTTVLTARTAFWPGTKLKRVREGLAQMDVALAEFPDDHNARFTRAVNNLYLPDLFERRSVVEADFAWLLRRPDRGDFDAEFRQYVFLYHGRALAKWKRPADAATTWTAGLAIDPQSKVADELRRELAAAKPAPPAP